MVACGIIEGVPRPLPASPPAELLRFQHGTEMGGGRPLSIFAAAGPFTTTESLVYEPLNDLLGAVRATRPDVVVLVGPFVDAEHPQVCRGRSESSRGWRGKIYQDSSYANGPFTNRGERMRCHEFYLQVQGGRAVIQSLYGVQTVNPRTVNASVLRTYLFRLGVGNILVPPPRWTRRRNQVPVVPLFSTRSKMLMHYFPKSLSLRIPHGGLKYS